MQGFNYLFEMCEVAQRLKMAKRCQEEYEDVSEVLHPSILSTLYMYHGVD